MVGAGEQGAGADDGARVGGAHHVDVVEIDRRIESGGAAGGDETAVFKGDKAGLEEKDRAIGSHARDLAGVHEFGLCGRKIAQEIRTDIEGVKGPTCRTAGFAIVDVIRISRGGIEYRDSARRTGDQTVIDDRKLRQVVGRAIGPDAVADGRDDADAVVDHQQITTRNGGRGGRGDAVAGADAAGRGEDDCHADCPLARNPFPNDRTMRGISGTSPQHRHRRFRDAIRFLCRVTKPPVRNAGSAVGPAFFARDLRRRSSGSGRVSGGWFPRP
ncbi:hypothetical protein MAA8898_04675 [Maliponia aquimaris]|uniref:Uncharacterized protein n=1 Tax=Maliponia aquimaris TaxID=1673631 RepID=A0A238L5J1_9RHOB|nr:hypothetical protein MAA8898_04675 [Maliponia aquimaris]